MIAFDPNQFMAALCIWREARGESATAQYAVLCVIRNRAADSRWPDSLAEVVVQPKQFSSFNVGDPNYMKFPDVNDKIWIDICALLDMEDADPTGQANHYFSGNQTPSWADPEKQTTQIGAFRFFKL